LDAPQSFGNPKYLEILKILKNSNFRLFSNFTRKHGKSHSPWIYERIH